MAEALTIRHAELAGDMAKDQGAKSILDQYLERMLADFVDPTETYQGMIFLLEKIGSEIDQDTRVTALQKSELKERLEKYITSTRNRMRLHGIT